MPRPLGAFISKWSENSPTILRNYGFIENGMQIENYNGQEVNIIKFKTHHRPEDNILNDGDDCTSFYDENTIHHLDFYINELKKLVNTDVYATQRPITKLPNYIESPSPKFIIEKDCSICLQKFNNPKRLPCSHCFCEKCLLNLYQCESLEKKCPLCRAKIQNF